MCRIEGAMGETVHKKKSLTLWGSALQNQLHGCGEERRVMSGQTTLNVGIWEKCGSQSSKEVATLVESRDAGFVGESSQMSRKKSRNIWKKKKGEIDTI